MHKPQFEPSWLVAVACPSSGGEAPFPAWRPWVMETVGQGWVVVQGDGVQNSSQIAALICQKQVTLWVQGAASSEWWQRPDLLKCRSMTTGCGVPAHDGGRPAENA